MSFKLNIIAMETIVQNGGQNWKYLYWKEYMLLNACTGTIHRAVTRALVEGGSVYLYIRILPD